MYSSSSNSRRHRFLKRGARGLTVSTNKQQHQPFHEIANTPSPSSHSNTSAHSSRSGSSHNSFADRFRLGRRRSKNQHQAFSSSSSLSPPAEGRLKLIPRIAEYKSRGIISAREEETYMQLLESRAEFDTATSSSGSDLAAQQVERLLDDAQKQFTERQNRKNKPSGSRSLFRKMAGASTSGGDMETVGPPETELGTLPTRRFVDTQQEEQGEVQAPSHTAPPRLSTGSTLTTATLTSTTQINQKSIVETEEVWDSDVIQDEQELEKLFVEMCFFARLGFVQPPSCLQCVYQESMEKKECSLECQRWVVWRKNARTLLHPNRLDENLVLVKCHAARQLIEGKAVESHEWDPIRRQLVYHM